MKATITNRKNKFTSSHRKETKCYFYSIQAVTTHGGYSFAPVELRLYGTDSQWTACVWINAAALHNSGSGKAGGYGYDKPSAAAHQAIYNAGIDLSEPIDGRGYTAIIDAVQAIAIAIGYPDAIIFKSHQ